MRRLGVYLALYASQTHGLLSISPWAADWLDWLYGDAAQASAKKLSLEQRLEALVEYKKKRGIESFFGPIPEDFDDPLPEDILIRPLPPLE